MKKLIVICLVCVLTAAASQGAIALPINISFDENGHGSWQTLAGGGALVWGMGIPIGAGTSDQYATLYYELPVIVAGGDLVIYEPTSTGQVSDVLRFVNNYNPNPNGGYQGRVYVYSEMEAGETRPELADTRIPYDFLNWRAGLEEQGTENGWNGVVYTPQYVPGTNQYEPGYMDMPYVVTYNFTSDVPEPATIGILGLGALSLLRKRRA